MTLMHHLHRMDLRTINRRRTFFVITKLSKICLEFNTVPTGRTAVHAIIYHLFSII
jgi:hypothetical protein